MRTEEEDQSSSQSTSTDNVPVNPSPSQQEDEKCNSNTNKSSIINNQPTINIQHADNVSLGSGDINQTKVEGNQNSGFPGFGMFIKNIYLIIQKYIPF